jgi:hypothetical protein
MRETIKRELMGHILDLINDGVLTNDNQEDWHFHAFNEDYYLIGYYQTGEWLREHGIGELEGASICRQYEIDNFGENTTDYDNTETIVNMLAYIYGGELLYSVGVDTVEDLKEEMI